MKELFEAVKRDADPAMQFFEECLECVDVEELGYDDLMDGVSSSAAVLAAYQDFCAANGYRFPLGRNKLLTRLLGLGVQPVDTVRRAQGRPARRAKGWGARIAGSDDTFTASDPD